MINRDFNKAIISGYLLAKPELKLTLNGIPVMNFVLKSEGIKQPELIDITVFGELAEKVYRDIDTNVRLMVEGTIHRRMKSDSDPGEVEITASRVFSLGGKDIEIY